MMEKLKLDRQESPVWTNLLYFLKWSLIAAVLGTTVEYLLTGKKEEPTVQDDGLTEGERALMKQFRQLTPEQQDMVIRMVQAAADKL